MTHAESISTRLQVVWAWMPRFPPGKWPVPSAAAPTCSLPSRSAWSHRLIHHALAGIASRSGDGEDQAIVAAYNPIVLVGPTGCGKSRLLGEWFLGHAGTITAAEHARPGAVMWDGASLEREIATALSRNAIDRLHQRFTAARVIIIDDVERITAWDVQRVLAHLFDSSSSSGTVFVATLRMHPIACTNLEPSLASRLSGGLVVSMPPVETSRGPLHSAAAGPREISIRRVINATARRHGLAPADLIGPSRSRHVAQARAMAMYLARGLSRKSLQAIGGAFGGRDHTTVLHGIRVTEVRRARDPGVAADIELLLDSLLSRGRTVEDVCR